MVQFLGVRPGVLPLLIGGFGRTTGVILAGVWSWVGYQFFLQHYSELTWVAEPFAYAFFIQAAVVLGCASTGRFNDKRAHRSAFAQWSGFALWFSGLAAYPFIAPLTGAGWKQAEVFGIHPDPTAVASLGMLLMATRGWSLWLSSFIPIVWCVISYLTLTELNAAWAPGLVAVIAIALAGMVWKSLCRKTGSTGARVKNE